MNAPLAATRAAAQLVRMPLRLGMEGDAPSPEEVIERGWVRGLREAGAVLEHLLGAAAANGSAFAATWPYVGGEEWLAAPGVPAVVTAEAQDAIDGVYRLSTDGVLREAAGEERLLLSTTGPPEASPERPFDLLWFSTSARPSSSCFTHM